MQVTIHIAETREELEQVYRLRYEIYVEELHIFGDSADHERQMLYGANDKGARILYAKCGDELVGSMRLNLGKDAPFSEELEKTYNLDRFREVVDDAQILVLTRFMVKKAYRGSQIAYRMIERVAEISLKENIEVTVCDCQPHLIRYYQRMGFRSYGCKVYNDPAFGIMVPLAFAVRDLDYLSAIRSPLRKALDQPVEDPEVVCKVVEQFGKPAVRAVDEVDSSQRDSMMYFLSEVSAADEAQTRSGKALFEGVPAEEIQSIISKAYLLTLERGDMVICKGQQTSTVYLVLSGELAVVRDGETVAHIEQKGVVGELGFLLNERRSADVIVSSTTAFVLAIDESRLKKKLKSRSPGMVQVLYNLCQILASRMRGKRALQGAPEITLMSIAA